MSGRHVHIASPHGSQPVSQGYETGMSPVGYGPRVGLCSRCSSVAVGSKSTECHPAPVGSRHAQEQPRPVLQRCRGRRAHTPDRDQLGGYLVTRGSVRRSVRIRRPAEEVWALVGDPARISEWFPGIVEATVDGDTRVIVTGTGIPIPEQILTNDPIQRRFQYRIAGPIVREHVSTLDVHDLGDGTSLAVYAADADPATMALVIAGAAGAAREHLRALMEGGRL